MALVIIPVDSVDACYDLEVDLGGTVYLIEIRWNTRGEYWTLDFSTITGEVIATGIKIVSDWDLLGHLSSRHLPVGKLVTVDTSGTGANPGREELGVRVLLMYYDG